MTVSLLAMGPMANGVVQGQYTEAQAAAGAEIYQHNCSGCHQPDLAGQNEALPLLGSSFMSTWRDRSIADIYTLTHGTMPRGGLCAAGGVHTSGQWGTIRLAALGPDLRHPHRNGRHRPPPGDARPGAGDRHGACRRLAAA